MSMIELLMEARAGIALPFPAKFEVLVDRETLAVWMDLELGVRVIAMHSTDPLDLRDSRAPTLAGDLEAGARRMSARTDDPDWSPIVEYEVHERDDGRILRCVHRLALQPGREMVRGLLLIPTAYGHISLSAIHDAHGSSRVQASLAQWLDPANGLAITPEPIKFPDGEMRVEFAGSHGSIVLPVGFMPQFADPSAKSRGFTTLVRVGIDETPEAKLTVSAVLNENGQIASVDELLAAARASAESWAEHGSAIEITTEQVTPTRHLAQVCVYASIRMENQTHLQVAHWILTEREVVEFKLWTRPPHQFGDWAPLVEEAVGTWLAG
jgi:hypothetical protein